MITQIGKPAYIMLNKKDTGNDARYQSEKQTNMTNKYLASENVGKQVLKNYLGSVYVWIPRYAYNNAGNITYIKQSSQVSGNLNLPDAFTYETASLDLSLSGIWVQTSTSSTSRISTNIKNMTGENNTYSFIANTIPINGAYENSIINTIKYFDPSGSYISSISNNNRVILKVVDTDVFEPIKANAKYDNDKITITVTYSKNNIINILDERGNSLDLSENNGIITANTGDRIIADTNYVFYIIDDQGNQRAVNTTVSSTGREPIDAEAVYDGKKINITVNRSAFAIAKILDREGNELSFNVDENFVTTANTGDKQIQSDTYTFTIIDVKGNKKDLTITVLSNDDIIEATITYASNKIIINAYALYGVSKITDEWNNILTLTTIDDNNATANTGSQPIINRTFSFTVTDTQGNSRTFSKAIAGTDNYYYVTYGSDPTVDNINVIGLSTFISKVNNGSTYIKGYQVINIRWLANYSQMQEFRGTYDGGGHTIDANGYSPTSSSGSNLGGFIGLLSGGTVKNLGITNLSISSSLANVGGIAGKSYFGSITNCYVTGSVQTSANGHCGGIVGYLQGTNISYCYNNAEVRNSYSGNNGDAGGIAGYIYYEGSINSCYNTGYISGAGYNGGGIVGHFITTSSTNYGSVSIENCYNIGDVYGYNSGGGIAGHSTSSYGTISYCYNKGTVRNGTSTGRVGGIAGNCSSITIKDSYNAGSIRQSNSNDTYRGAICGYNNSNVSSCYYVSGTASYGLGSKKSTGCSTYSTSNYPTHILGKVQSFVTVDGTSVVAFKIVSSKNGGYPILYWQ